MLKRLPLEIEQLIAEYNNWTPVFNVVLNQYSTVLAEMKDDPASLRFLLLFRRTFKEFPRDSVFVKKNHTFTHAEEYDILVAFLDATPQHEFQE